VLVARGRRPHATRDQQETRARDGHGEAGEPRRWSHPLTIAVVTALIGFVGVVVAALISSSGDDSAGDAARIVRPDLAVSTVTFDVHPDGSQVIEVVGVSRKLTAGHEIHAIARPVARGQAASATAAEEKQAAPLGPEPWLTSPAAKPDDIGRWVATIRVPPPPRKLTVVAVDVPSPDTEPEEPPCEGGGGCAGSASSDIRHALREAGPAVASRSSPPVIAEPPSP
jgi:hypothetical protein